MKNTNAYYNYDKICSYNGVFNFIIGMRGVGKSYGAKKRAVDRALKYNEQFIYIRRYKDELATGRDAFLADLLAKNAWPDWDFKMTSKKLLASPKKQPEGKDKKWQILGHFIPLSIAQTMKSVAFPNVHMMIFDEFIIEKGTIQYLPNEVIAMQNFYSTVDRGDDRVKVFFLANSVSIMNPYFNAYKIRPDTGKDKGKEFIKRHDGFIVVHIPTSEDFKSATLATRFGRFISDTEYADYAVGNKFADNTENLIAFKDATARYMYSLECKHGTFSIWFDVMYSRYFIQGKLPKSQKVFTLLPEKMDTHKTLLTFNDKLLGMLRTAFRQGNVWFDEPATRNVFAEVFSR